MRLRSLGPLSLALAACRSPAPAAPEPPPPAAVSQATAAASAPAPAAASAQAPTVTVTVVPAEPSAQAASAQINPEFVGLWRVDQPAHAGYEASFYRLKADGAVEHLVGRDVGNDGPVGHVGKRATQATPSVSCLFGKRWRSLSSSLVGIAGECSDSKEREIVFLVSGPTIGREGAMEVRLVSVGGEKDWAHGGWQWSFALCKGPGRCFPE